jgi:hypothetical protein
MRLAFGLCCVVVAALVVVGAAANSSTRRTRATQVTVGSSLPTAPSALVKRVTIGGTRYWLINTVRAAGLIRSPYAKIISTAIRACPSAASWGFWDDQNDDFGIVAYLPGNPVDCFGVRGGGPGGGPGSRGPCAQLYRTPNLRTWVAIAGTSTDICADMSTQVPGGAPGTTLDTSDSDVIDADTNVWVTCQEMDQGLLWDYVTPRFGNVVKFPLSRVADWIDDQEVDTGFPDWIPHVPHCSGVNTDF